MLLAQRLLAVFVIVIPGLLAGYGWNIMRDVIFFSFTPEGGSLPVLKFIGGLALFLLGVAFIAGFFVHRDKKKKKI
ncbi:DUF2627 family protein [Ammoniphilus sp. CFH 90114]|uniref:DUF2627 family protein n=1 Tax=Ammoniphilus sp. CFH 90114 TaxID=2493665 RepID=UPI00100EDF69|nr:DUF2627 family protein [Ammoniphilus sp. CFH 90114]RXT13809.1 DUF2627 family protein [Ammoniphilus sp. CFH 90114]